VRGKKGHGPVPVDTTVEQVAEGDFDALVIPGGYAPDKLRALGDRAGPGAGVRRREQADRLHLPRGLGADLGPDPGGPRATSVGAIRDDMVNAGTDWVDEATVVDGNSSRPGRPPTSDRGRKALLKALAVG
jgi:protease I